MRALLLCPPDYYGIEYEINPWMSRARGAEAALAQEQWRCLEATHFFAVTNSAPTLNLIAPSPRCSDVLLSQWNLSIHAFTISTLVFVRCPTARPFGFRLRSTNTDSTPFANTFLS